LPGGALPAPAAKAIDDLTKALGGLTKPVTDATKPLLDYLLGK
jgi:hypothetical protein